MNPRDLVTFIFRDNFSTAQAVNEVSGPGRRASGRPGSRAENGRQDHREKRSGQGDRVHDRRSPGEAAAGGGCMKAEYANIFIRSAVEVFQKEGNVQLTRKDLAKKNSPMPSLPVSIILGITGFLRGQACTPWTTPSRSTWPRR